MEKRKPLWDIFPEKQKKECLDRIIAYFLDERDEKIGLIAAEDIFHIVLEKAFSDIYNKGVLDAQQLIRTKGADIEAELDLLLRSN
ncbi:MAG: DUF2164 family protein [Patescibacteria group bacterium]